MKTAAVDLMQVGTKTGRRELHWIAGKKRELEVFELPTELLYFNIENGRYADMMVKLRREHVGKDIDPRLEKWKNEIEKMLSGDHKDTSRDRAAFERLVEDIRDREQLRPGVVLLDGGVLDGNRRLAALRSLARDAKNPAKYGRFNAVILPSETSEIDRWRIEAGLQLGMNERWDYAPINELLKVRQGIQMYTRLRAHGKSAGKDPLQAVADAIFGKTKEDVAEMAERLALIDQYLEFIEKDEQYDLVAKSSEQFLEAAKIMAAVKNQQRPAAFVARIRAALFYTIKEDLMNNFELRDIYAALGGDPRRRGRKYAPDETALTEWLQSFSTDPHEIQRSLLGKPAPATTARPTTPQTGTTRSSKANEDATGSRAPRQGAVSATAPATNKSNVEAHTERFKRQMAARKNKKSARKFAEGALADIQNLERFLLDKKKAAALTADEKSAVRDALKSIDRSVKTCTQAVK